MRALTGVCLFAGHLKRVIDPANINEADLVFWLEVLGLCAARNLSHRSLSVRPATTPSPVSQVGPLEMGDGSLVFPLYPVLSIYQDMERNSVLATMSLNTIQHVRLLSGPASTCEPTPPTPNDKPHGEVIELRQNDGFIHFFAAIDRRAAEMWVDVMSSWLSSLVPDLVPPSLSPGDGAAAFPAVA